MNPPRTQQHRFPAPPPGVDAICDAFEADWFAGHQPRIEDFLPRGEGVDHDELLRELLVSDWDLHRRNGQDVELPAYHASFPDRTDFITHLWHVWNERPSEKVEDESAPNGSETMSAGGLLGEPGAVIDRYRLLETLGEGAFGTVWAAEQREPVKRRVALKVIKLGMDTRQVIARFEAERQALALMDHPNIAKVLDAGATQSGRPYFVMELVHGIPITKYCDQEGLATGDRLDLFIKVCQAIQHSHQKGIIHRDIKPSNILVTLHDDVPVPKVIDFGIAKAIQQELTEKTIYTQFQQFIGTPAYMSPEQAEMSGLDIDTRSDIYSLGVLLYELLTGTTPFGEMELMESGPDEMRKIIREREPLKPSSRLSRDSATAKASHGHHLALPTPRSAIDRDLDCIVMKCLEKDRMRRYETASDLASDIRRHMNDEPILALSPSAAYKLRKFIRRNWRSVLAAAALLLVLCLGLVGTSLGLVRARGEALRARLAESAATEDRDRAYIARQQALQARSDERRLNFQMALDRGLALCDQGHVGSGMLWLTRALKLAPSDALDVQRVIRANLAAWQRELHMLQGIYPQKQGLVTGTFSPDGTLVLTGAHDGVVQLWDRRTGRARGAPLRHDAEVHEAVFSPDGTYFLTTSIDKTARLWETSSGQLLRVFLHDSAVYAGLFTQDGRIITSSSDGSIQVWDRDLENPIDAWRHTTNRGHDLDAASGSVHDIAISPDGKQILGACDDGIVLLWDLQTHRVIARFIGHSGRVPTAVFVGPDRIASADTDGNVFLWTWPQAETPVLGERIGEPWRHRGGVHRLRVSASGDPLLTASFDTRAQLLDSETGKPIGVPFEHQGGLKSVAFSRDGSILTACEDDGAREWRPAPGCLEIKLPHGAGTQQAIFTPDAQHVLIRGADGTASIRRALNGKPLGMPFEPDAFIHGFAVSPDESKVMTAAGDGKVQFWETATGLPVGETFKHGGGAWAVAISQDGKQAVSSGLDGVVKRWDVLTGRPLHPLLSLDAAIRGVAFSPDGSRIAIASSDKLAWIIETENPEVARALEGHHGSVMTVAFSHDGKRVVTGSFDNTVIVWDAETGFAVSRPMRHGGPFWYAVTFSRDGRTVVAGCDDHTARIWDVATAKPIGPTLPHDAALRTAAFTEDDSRIICGTSAGTTYVWDVPRSPMPADVERIALWLQVSTGMELDDDGQVRPLDPETWRQRRKRLDELGGVPSE